MELTSLSGTTKRSAASSRNAARTLFASLATLSAGLLLASPALADAPAITVDKGDVSWMLTSTVLVLLMTVPGLALFYGGLVRTKNMLSMLTQILAIVCLVCIVWFLYGYSLAFTDGGSLNAFVGGFSKAFLAGVNTSSVVETFSVGVGLPELVFVCFQMTFAAITTALVVGGFAERMKFGSLMVFAVLWSTFVYFPIAHMVWWWPGPIAIATNPTMDAAAAAGMSWAFGAIDFAGGTVVHINAGIAGFVGAILLGRRIGYGREPMPPHSLTLTMTGAALLWVGWFGFNAGSNLESNAYAALAMANTFIATAGAGFSWMMIEWIFKGKPSLLGLASGVVAGLVAVTPACGFAGPMGALVLGLIAGVVSYFFCSAVKNALGYDDTLDVFGVHAIAGIIGAIGTGILVDPALGGAGIVDYASCAADGDITTCDVAAYDMATQVMAQAKGVLLTIVWSGVGSTVIFLLIGMVFGLRVSEETEREGLDIAEHGERAYNM
ncbi:MAG: ammonium transporter [Alphaproteobacteria bacterium]|nr:ammonium transporter [Alphaproteobacteria bacterium]